MSNALVSASTSSAPIPVLPKPHPSLLTVSTNDEYPRSIDPATWNALLPITQVACWIYLNCTELRGFVISEKGKAVARIFSPEEIHECVKDHLTGVGCTLVELLWRNRMMRVITIPKSLNSGLMDVMVEVAGVYYLSKLNYSGRGVGKSGRSNLGSKKATRKKLLEIGYSEKDAKGHSEKAKVGGVQGRVIRDHYAEEEQEKEATLKAKVWNMLKKNEGILDPPVLPFQPFVSNCLASKSGPLDEGVLEFEEHIMIVLSAAYDNAPFEAVRTKALAALGIDFDYPATRKPTVQIQIGLEASVENEYRTRYLREGALLLIGNYAKEDGRATVISTTGSLLEGSRYKLPLVVSKKGYKREVLVTVSFNEAGARERYERVSADQRLTPFGPVVRKKCFAAVIVRAVHRKTKEVHYMCIGEGLDSNANSLERLEFLHASLVNKLSVRWNELAAEDAKKEEEEKDDVER